MDVRRYLHEMLDYMGYRLDHGCTKEEMDAFAKMLEQHMELYGEAKDFAEFFGVSEKNARATISRRLIDKPKRRVYYPFHKLLKVVPESWLARREAQRLGKDRPKQGNEEVNSQ